jgi:hypothetical protein
LQGGRAAGGPAWNRQQYMAMVSYLDASIGAKNARLFCAHFYTKNDHFAKTGSGQT